MSAMKLLQNTIAATASEITSVAAAALTLVDEIFIARLPLYPDSSCATPWND